MQHPLVAVIGPTATGKSALGLDLAERLGGEIVGADASQLYRGMDIGTAKLLPHERRGIPHHQIDVLDILEDATVASYQEGARRDIDAIYARGSVPVLVGGSGLYVRAAVDQLEIPPTDPEVRERLEAEADELGTPGMYARLCELDPESAVNMQRNNTRRIVRALEVIELTGRPYSSTMPKREFLRPTVLLGLRMDRSVLDERIARRTQAMWDGGLMEEVAALEERGLSRGRTASRAVGYREALAQLVGRMSEEEAIDITTMATRRLVRRQESWFRPDPRIIWLDAAAPDLFDQALSHLPA